MRIYQTGWLITIAIFIVAGCVLAPLTLGLGVAISIVVIGFVAAVFVGCVIHAQAQEPPSRRQASRACSR